MLLENNDKKRGIDIVFINMFVVKISVSRKVEMNVKLYLHKNFFAWFLKTNETLTTLLT